MKPTLVIADDSPEFLEKLRGDLSQEFEILGEAQDGEEAVRLCRELSPDFAVLDAAMPRLSGIDAIRRILKEVPVPPTIVMVSALSEEWVVFQALEAGAVDYLVKPIDGETLCRVLKSYAKAAA